jgi:hypothetical protein
VSKNLVGILTHRDDMSIVEALRTHWPEYVIEGWGLGCLMISVGIFVSLLNSSRSPLYAIVPGETTRLVLLALLVGATLVLLVHSPWGKRSGAHMNPRHYVSFPASRKDQTVGCVILCHRALYWWDARCSGGRFSPRGDLY